MILPIIIYGHPTLVKETEDIDANFPDLQELIKNMWQTMYNASGVGLAAPQINQSIRLFIVDTVQLQNKKDNKDVSGIKKVFINATIIEENGKEWKYEEGCLSIPGFREYVQRKPSIKIHYFDEHFNEFEETYDGINARVIQHEYDHVDGILFTDRLKPLTKKLATKKLEKIRKGIFEADYKTKTY